MIWLVSFGARAMEFRFLDMPDGLKVVVGLGPIVEGDTERLRQALSAAGRDHWGNKVLALHSPGGSVSEALRMSALMGRERVSTMVPEPFQCASACAQILFVAGAYRTVLDGGLLGIHSCSRGGVRSDLCNDVIAQHALEHGVEYGALAAPQTFVQPDGMAWYTAREADCWGLSLWPREFNRGRVRGEPSICTVASIWAYTEARDRHAMQPAVLVPRVSTTPSFNCARARSDMERLICSDNDLARTDQVLGLVYRARLALCAPTECERVRREQIEWLASRGVVCGLPGTTSTAASALIGAKGCVLRETRERIEKVWGSRAG